MRPFPVVVPQVAGLALVLLTSVALFSAHLRAQNATSDFQTVVLASLTPEQVRRCLVEAGGSRQILSSLPGFVLLPTSAATALVRCEAGDGRSVDTVLAYRPPLGWPVFVWIAFDAHGASPQPR